MNKEKIGYIGIGIMGKPMVENLVKASYSVSVYARREASIQALGLPDIDHYPNPAELAKHCNVVISCVSDTPDVEEVLIGPEGIIHGIQPNALVIDMSTISSKATRAMAAKFKQANASMLDAPVSGGEVGAISGTLSIMVGGEPKEFDRAKPIFEALGKNIVHVGDSGAGQVAKACNNLLAAQTVVAMAEAFLLAQSEGVDAAKVREALLGGFAYSRVLELHGQRVLEGNYAPGFKTNLHAKDLRIALANARENGIAMPGTELANKYLDQLIEQGDGELDSSAIAKAVGSG